MLADTSTRVNVQGTCSSEFGAVAQGIRRNCAPTARCDVPSPGRLLGAAVPAQARNWSVASRSDRAGELVGTRGPNIQDKRTLTLRRGYSPADAQTTLGPPAHVSA
jgi:hypothetical protein